MSNTDLKQSASHAIEEVWNVLSSEQKVWALENWNDLILEFRDSLLEKTCIAVPDAPDIDDPEAPNVYPYKKCCECGERKSCGQYDDCCNWFCEDCFVEEEEEEEEKPTGA